MYCRAKAKLPSPKFSPGFPLSLPALFCFYFLLSSNRTFPRLLPQSIPPGKSAWPAPRCSTSIPPRIHAAAISVVHVAHSSLHYAPAVPASFHSLHVHAGQTPPLLDAFLTASARHHALFASLIRASFRLAGIFTISSLICLTFGRFISSRHSPPSLQPFRSRTAACSVYST